MGRDPSGYPAAVMQKCFINHAEDVSWALVEWVLIPEGRDITDSGREKFQVRWSYLMNGD